MLLYNAYIYLSGMQNKKLCQCSDAGQFCMVTCICHFFAKNFVKIKIELQLKTEIYAKQLNCVLETTIPPPVQKDDK